MARFRKNWTGLVALAAVIGLVTTGGAVGDQAQPGGPQQSALPDRVVMKLDQHLAQPEPVEASGLATTRIETFMDSVAPVPADESPRVGEVVQVRYANANVVHVGVSRGCTITTTAGTPYKSSGKALATTSYAQTGCSGVTGAASGLNFFYWGWHTKSRSDWVPVNGGTYTQYHMWTCATSGVTAANSWVGNSFTGGTYNVINESPSVDLACGI